MISSSAQNYRAHTLAAWLLVLLALTVLTGCRQTTAANGANESELSATAVPTISESTPSPAPTVMPTERPASGDVDEVAAEPDSELETASEDAREGEADEAAGEEVAAHAAAEASTPTEDSPEESAGEGDEETAQPTDNENTAAANERATATIEPSPTVTPTATTRAPIVLPASGQPLDGTTNILVLGSDRRPGRPNWRTDVIMIVALDTENGRVGVISIPRDVYVNNPPRGYGANKINTMDYFGETNHPGGGPELLSTIIEEKMGVPIHHFVRFNFEAFRKVVDALGGVEVEFECSFYGDMGGRSKHIKLQMEPGVHRLDGDQATIYVRSRAVGGDLDRAARQQRFVWSIRQQALSENLLPKLPALYSALSGSVQTDVGLLDAVRLARFVVNLEPTDVHAFVVGPPDMLSYGRSRRLSYFHPHWNVIAERAQEVFETGEFAETNEIVSSKGSECK